jgi:hypothetical protein
MEKMSLQKSRAVSKAMDQAKDQPELIEREVRKQLARVEEEKMRDTTDELDEMEDSTPVKSKKSSAATPSTKKAASKRSTSSRAESPVKATPSRKSRGSTAAASTEGSSRKRRTPADEEVEEPKVTKRSKRSAKVEGVTEQKKVVASDSDKLMRWRHVLQKTFIKDKAVGDKPRASPETLDTVEWDAVVSSLDEFNEYVQSPECSYERLYETKLHKVVKMIFHNTLAPEVEARMKDYSIRPKINKLADVFQKQSVAVNGAHSKSNETDDVSETNAGKAD